MTSNGIALNTLKPYFFQADKNQDQRLSYQEIAETALTLLKGEPEASHPLEAILGLSSPEDDMVGSLFATFLTGGTHGLGLSPDFNQDRSLDWGEFISLAEHGDSTMVEVSDFEVVFPDTFNPDGSEIDYLRLSAFASSGSPVEDLSVNLGGGNPMVHLFDGLLGMMSLLGEMLHMGSYSSVSPMVAQFPQQQLMPAGGHSPQSLVGFFQSIFSQSALLR